MATLADLGPLGGETTARDPDRRVSIAPQPTRSFSDSTLGAADELPPPVTVLPAVRRSRIVSPAPPRPYAGDVYEVEWIDDPGVFHRADFQAVRAAGSSPARGAAPKAPTWSPNARAAPAASYAMLGFSQPAAPEPAAPAAPERQSTGSGRAAAQEASRRIREQSS